MTGRHELTDAEWALISPLLPNKPRGVARVDDRRVISGIFHVLRTGAPWRGLTPGVFHQGTFNACPLSAAGALAALEDLATGAPQAHADRIAAALRQGAVEIMDRLGIQGACYGDSSTFHFYFGPCEGRSVMGLTPAQIRGTPKAVMSGFRDALCARGVDLMSAMSGVTSSAHSDADVDETLAAFDGALTELQAGGLIA